MNTKDVIQSASSSDGFDETKSKLDVTGEPDQNTERHGGRRSGGKPQRATATLGHGRSVIVVGHDLEWETWLSTIQLALTKGRRAKAYGLELHAFLKMLADVARQ